MMGIESRTYAMLGKCQGNSFPHKNVMELSGKYGPFCNFREMSEI